jgi:hypothetical protein
MAKMKKKLTQMEEFKILTLVMDKFLWAAFLLMAFGFYNISTQENLNFVQGPGFLVSGILLFGIFVLILVKEYEFLK